MQLNGITLNGKSILPELYLYIQGLVMSPPEQPVTQEKLFIARGIIGELWESVLLSPKLLNFGTRNQITESLP